MLAPTRWRPMTIIRPHTSCPSPSAN